MMPLPKWKTAAKPVAEIYLAWTTHYALFARQAFTDATRKLAAEHEVRLLTLPQMAAALGDC